MRAGDRISSAFASEVSADHLVKMNDQQTDGADNKTAASKS